jgi:hypothetical protein
MAKMVKTQTELHQANKKLEDEKELLEMAVVVHGKGDGVGDELGQMLLARLAKKAKEEDAAAEQARERMKRSQLAIGRDAGRKNAEIAALQQACSHLDQHSQKRTGGQFLSNGTYAVFCLFCFKAWTNDGKGEQCPPHLWPDEVGGAVMDVTNRIGAAPVGATV